MAGTGPPTLPCCRQQYPPGWAERCYPFGLAPGTSIIYIPLGVFVSLCAFERTGNRKTLLVALYTGSLLVLFIFSQDSRCPGEVQFVFSRWGGLVFLLFEMLGISPWYYGCSHGTIHIHASKLGSLEELYTGNILTPQHTHTDAPAGIEHGTTIMCKKHNDFFTSQSCSHQPCGV